MMTTFQLVSTCDDAGNLLAGRLENPDFVRVIESHETKEAAEQAKSEWMRHYARNQTPIGSGCLSVRES
jgi:transcriptional regulator GlxA family with amidase domain